MRRTNTDTTHYLRWFFTESQAAVSGMRSSYWALVEMAQSGAVRQAHSGTARTPSSRALQAADRENDIAARLERLTVEERVILSLAFGPSPWPVVGVFEQREDRKRLGEYPGVALVAARAQRAFLSALQKRERKAGEDERPIQTTVEGSDEDRLTSAHRLGEDPRAGVKAMADRGFIGWLRGPTLSEALLKEIQEECARLVKAAVRAWDVVAPHPDREGIVRHDQHRRAAYGPAQAVRVEERATEDGDRISDVYPIDPNVIPWRREREAG